MQLLQMPSVVEPRIGLHCIVMDGIVTSDEPLTSISVTVQEVMFLFYPNSNQHNRSLAT